MPSCRAITKTNSEWQLRVDHDRTRHLQTSQTSTSLPPSWETGAALSQRHISRIPTSQTGPWLANTCRQFSYCWKRLDLLCWWLSSCVSPCRCILCVFAVDSMLWAPLCAWVEDDEGTPISSGCPLISLNLSLSLLLSLFLSLSSFLLLSYSFLFSSFCWCSCFLVSSLLSFAISNIYRYLEWASSLSSR